MFSIKIHRIIFLFGIISLFFGMMLGTVPTSIPQFILIINWLIEGDFTRKISALKKNKFFYIITAFYLLHLIGLLYSTHYVDGLNDIRIKLPLLVLPLILFTTAPLSKTEIDFCLYSFLLGTLCNLTWCLFYSFVLHTDIEIRQSSRFMSHIRLGLYLNMAILTCWYFFVRENQLKFKTIFFVLILFFALCLIILGLGSGTAVFIIILFIGLFSIIKTKLWLAIPIVIVFITGIFFSHKFISSQLTEASSNANKIQNTTQHNKSLYHFDNTNTYKENGFFVYRNVQMDEIKRGVKHIFFADSANSITQSEKFTSTFFITIRYLSSMQLIKDSLALQKLSEEDIINIKKGITNCDYTQWNFFYKRLYELLSEYQSAKNNNSINNQSLSMRLYFWQAALHVIKNNILFGVGTGDVQTALNKAYSEIHSPLQTQWHKRPHNQFITITVALGIVGLFLFLLLLFYPSILLKKYLHPLYIGFILISIFSFLFEDTLETQAGLTFFAGFYVFFISSAYSQLQQKTL
ncbi:MAG: O-antigen ligase family protein [Bacteroidetes bacterium]|nr:O-antigen ligase family protein [Bacteroidota bacterium]